MSTLLTDELRGEVEHDLALGMPVALVAVRCGVSRRTLTRWLSNGRVVRRRLAAASPARGKAASAIELPCEQELVGLIGQAARAGNWRASAWLLERAFPERWASSSRRGKPVALSGPVTDDPFREIDELAARRRREQFDRDR